MNYNYETPVLHLLISKTLLTHAFLPSLYQMRTALFFYVIVVRIICGS